MRNKPDRKDEYSKRPAKIVDINNKRPKNPERIIENSKLGLSLVVVNNWLTSKTSTSSYSEVIKSLGIVADALDNKNIQLILDSIEKSFVDDPDQDLLQELQANLEAIGKNFWVDPNSRESIDNFLQKMEEVLQDWYLFDDRENGYTSCQKRLARNARSLKLEMTQKLQESIRQSWDGASIRESLLLLDSLEKCLMNLQEDLSAESSEFEEKEQGFEETYQRNWQFQQDLTKRLALGKNTLLGLYKFKIKSLVYRLASEIFKSLLLDISIYKKTVKESEILLLKITKELVNQLEGKDCRVLLPMVFENISNYLNLEKLRQKGEEKLGKAIVYWGRSEDINSIQVREFLWSELEPVSQKFWLSIYEQLQQKFSE